jgi:hypothetical protein
VHEKKVLDPSEIDSRRQKLEKRDEAERTGKGTPTEEILQRPCK